MRLGDLGLLQGKNRGPQKRRSALQNGFAPRLVIFGIISPSIFLRPREAREVAMRFRRTLTFLILALVFALTAGAQQKPVAPGLSPARADVAASLPRHGGVKPPLRYAALKDGATTPGI